jgi:glutamate carboxypeptidase
MGAEVKAVPSRTTGDHLLARFRFTDDPRARQILLLGHMDTVWGEGTLARMPFRIEHGRAYGPGVFDMKGGIVIALFALEALRAMKARLRRNVTFLLNADEEIRSLSSRPTTEREARRSDYVLVVEPPHGLNGALKTARSAVGKFVLRVKGLAAHAGIEPRKGASAISELANQIINIEYIANKSKYVTLRAGVVRGGTRANVIPAEAEAILDVRAARPADMERVERQLRSLVPVDPRTKLVVTGGFNRPPLERTRQVAALFERARNLARPLGIRLHETAVGGGSDGSFAAALGVPTLDGLGAVGDGAHAEHEHIVIKELPGRAALLAHLIVSLGSE